ncbi:hypothetical protein GQ54DRAFT_23850 [Martensiomyces pterosporus]|nr:hypothetical protein GQ54DRAFT_23850 [Martensiomyces pterosporus]
MVILRTTSPLVALLLLLQPTYSHGSNANSKRGVVSADVLKIKGGVLAKNWYQTSCTLGVIDHQASFVSANCFDFINGKLNTTTLYHAYLDNGNGTASVKYTIEQIHVHPEYNPKTLANNIAVVVYNSPGSNPFTNQIAANKTEWTEIAYVRRYMGSLPNLKWVVPSVAPDMKQYSECRNASLIYSANMDSWLCTTMEWHSTKAECTVPYGAAYGAAGSSLAIAALYSHTAVRGTKICADATEYNYFTMLSRYVGFAASVLKRGVSTFASNQQSTVTDATVLAMKDVANSTISGVSVFGGDIYPLVGLKQKSKGTDRPPQSSTSAIATPSPTSPASTLSSTPSSTPTIAATPTAQPDNSSAKLTRTQTIVVATVVPIVSIALIAGLFFLYKWWRRRKSRVRLSPYRDNLRVMSTTQFTDAASSHHAEPPTYDSLAGPKPLSPKVIL